jgi:hypothetical protein
MKFGRIGIFAYYTFFVEKKLSDGEIILAFGFSEIYKMCVYFWGEDFQRQEWFPLDIHIRPC